MLLDKFFINVLIRVTFIVATSVALGIALQHLDRGYYYTLTGMIFLIIQFQPRYIFLCHFVFNLS